MWNKVAVNFLILWKYTFNSIIEDKYLLTVVSENDIFDSQHETAYVYKKSY